MSKKIAVVVRDRQDEAIRMSIGLTLMDDSVDVFMLNRQLIKTKQNALNIDTLEEMGVNVYSNVEGDAESSFEPADLMAKDILSYDHILAY